MVLKKHKFVWRFIMGCGVFAVAFGISWIAYGTVVVARGPFPAMFSGFLTNGMFIIGLGMGYLIVVPVVRDQGKKIKKLEEQLHAENTNPA